MIPSAYTDFTLAAYMATVTNNVAAALGWTADNFSEAVNDTLLAYGVTTAADAGDIPRLRALAKVEAWRAVADATAADFNFSADGGSYSREQIHQHALDALTRAQAQAAPFVDDLGGFVIQPATLAFNDGYGVPNAEV